MEPGLLRDQGRQCRRGKLLDWGWGHTCQPNNRGGVGLRLPEDFGGRSTWARVERPGGVGVAGVPARDVTVE